MSVTFRTPVTRDQFAAAWAEVPERDRVLVVSHLREFFKPEYFADVRRLRDADPEGWAIASHFFGGMAARNKCREVMRDDALPGVRYGWIAGEPLVKNWDDYYVAALEDAAALRPPPPARIAEPTYLHGDPGPSDGIVARVLRRLVLR